MKNFRRLCFAVVLTAAFCLPGLAQTPGGFTDPCTNPGEMNSPPCTAPGDIHTPGFASQQTDETDPGDMHTPGFASQQTDETDPGDVHTPGFIASAILFAIF
jgi:hypothetical protein